MVQLRISWLNRDAPFITAVFFSWAMISHQPSNRTETALLTNLAFITALQGVLFWTWWYQTTKHLLRRIFEPLDLHHRVTSHSHDWGLFHLVETRISSIKQDRNSSPNHPGFHHCSARSFVLNSILANNQILAQKDLSTFRSALPRHFALSRSTASAILQKPELPISQCHPVRATALYST